MVAKSRIKASRISRCRSKDHPVPDGDAGSLSSCIATKLVFGVCFHADRLDSGSRIEEHDTGYFGVADGIGIKYDVPGCLNNGGPQCPIRRSL